jgi:hypothetical protein
VYTFRFIAVLLAAGSLAFLLGTRFIAPTRGPVHPLSGRTIPGIATNPEWMDRPERARQEEPDRALALIGIQPGMRVADIGAGTGYMFRTTAATVGWNIRLGWRQCDLATS